MGDAVSVYCPATQGECDRPCRGSLCDRLGIVDRHKQIPFPPTAGEIASEELRKEREREQLEDDNRQRVIAQTLLQCAERVIAAQLEMQRVLDGCSLADPIQAPEQWRKFMIAMLGMCDAVARLNAVVELRKIGRV